MPQTALERIKRILSGKRIHPFDFVNNRTFYAPRFEEETEYIKRLDAQVKVDYVAANASMRGLPFVFVPGSMSNGYHAYALAEDYGDKIKAGTKAWTGEAFLTTQRLKHHVASSELLNRVVLPASLQNKCFIREAKKVFPEMAVVGPIDFEGSLRMARGDNAVSQGATKQDIHFERWWGPRVIDSSAMMLAGDHAYSRYANVEEVIGDMIQAGFLDEYRDHAGPGKNYDITDDQGRPVPLADRAWETARHIVDVVERGFRTDLAVAALVERFQLDDWLRNPKDSPLDMDKVHPVLTRREMTEMKRMERLKELMLPYLAQKCASWMPYQDQEDVKAYFEAHVLPAAAKPLDDKAIKALKKEIFSYLPRGGFAHPQYSTAKQETSPKQSTRREFDVASSVRPVTYEGSVLTSFDKKSSLFAIDHFGKLSQWEQAALRYTMGALGSYQLSHKAPNAFIYVCDPKGGVAAKEWADKNGIEWLKEAQSASDPVNDSDSFYKEVIEKNVAFSAQAQADLLKEPALVRRNVAHVISSLDLLEIRDAAQKNRDFVAAKGPDRYSSRAHLAFCMEVMRRNSVHGAVFHKGWQHNAHDVQMMLAAVLHVTGQIERPYEGGRHRMEIFVHDPEARRVEDRVKKQSLYDIATTLARTVEEQLDRTPPVPDRETYVACARILEIVDKLADPGGVNFRFERNAVTGAVTKTEHEIIKWGLVDEDFIKFWFDAPAKKAELSATSEGAAMKSLRDRVREKLLTAGVLEFDAEDLTDLNGDYEAAWSKANADDLLRRRIDRPSQGAYLDRRHPV